jgi:two-component system, chemotaxis family, chemotaxis protein CheY
MTKVLVVDDALFMRTALSNMLEEWGFEIVAQAANGKEAVAMYKEHSPDLVTMDLTMPVMSGLDALKLIMQDDPEAKVIMITALGQQRIIVDALENGAKDFVTKPFQPENLKEVVFNVLKISH